MTEILLLRKIGKHQAGDVVEAGDSAYWGAHVAAGNAKVLVEIAEHSEAVIIDEPIQEKPKPAAKKKAKKAVEPLHDDGEDDWKPAEFDVEGQDWLDVLNPLDTSHLSDPED